MAATRMMRCALVLLSLIGGARAQCDVSGLTSPLQSTGYTLNDGTTACANGDTVADGEVCSLSCASGYEASGTAASCSSTTFTAGSETCVDIDECTAGTDNCAAVGSTCTNLDGTFLCTCAAGYTGSGTVCTENQCVVGSGYPAGVGVEIERDTCAEQDMTGLDAAADAATCNAIGSCTFTCTGTATPECSGTATDTSTFPDCAAAFASSGECPVGCTGTPTCDVDASTPSSGVLAADVCPAGCTETCGPTVADGSLGDVSALGTASCDASYDTCTGANAAITAPAGAVGAADACQQYMVANPGAACPAGCAVPTAQCLVPSAAFTFNGCLERNCIVTPTLMAAANIVASSTAWEATGLASGMGQLSCAAGYHGVPIVTCSATGAEFTYSGCAENVCTAASGNPSESWVVVASAQAAATTVTALTPGLSCMSGFAAGTGAAVACVDHGGVFSFTGCVETVCTPTSATFTDAHVVAEDTTATTVSGLGALTCSAGYHSACTGTATTPVTIGGSDTSDCAAILANTFACPAGCASDYPRASCAGAGFTLSGCLPNVCTAPGGPTPGGVATSGVRVTNSAEGIVGEEVATAGLDGNAAIDGLGLGASCTGTVTATSANCAEDAGWIAAGTQATCPTGCDFLPACLGPGWDGDFRQQGWTGGDGLGVTTATCATHGGEFVFAGCTDVDDCATGNGDCGADAGCTNVAGGRVCECLSAADVTGTTGYVGNCPIGESYCKAATPYCRTVGGTETGVDETTCETALADEGIQANQWTDNLHLSEAACTGTWTACTSHTPTMCFAQLPQHCAGAFSAFGTCLDPAGVEHPCECPTGDCTHSKTYQISSIALDAAPRYVTILGGPDSDVPVQSGAVQGTAATAASCPQLEPTCVTCIGANDPPGCTGATPGGTDCAQAFSYASGTTRFSGGAVLAHTAPGTADCPTGCLYNAIASSGVDANYVVETSCSEYVNNVPRLSGGNPLVFTAGYCSIVATDATVCANGQYTNWDGTNCIRTIATSEETCEVFPHPEVSECAAVPMTGTAATADAACVAVPGCVYVANTDDVALPGSCTPVGGSTWVPNACSVAGGVDECSAATLLTPAATNAAANQLTCEAQAGCVYTPDDAGTSDNEETCLIRDEAACENSLVSIQTGLNIVSGMGLFVGGGDGTIDVGDTITVVQAIGSDLVGETRQIVSVASESMATVDAAWAQDTGGVAMTHQFSTGTGACPGRMRQNKLEHDMETLSASLLATNTDTRDQVSQAIQANRAANLATATAVEASLAAKVTAMATEQTDRRTDRDVVEAALTTMASDVASRHATALTAATTALTDTQTRIDAAHAAMGTEATRVHTLMEHQLEQHNTDTAMLSEQRTLFEGAFDAQATLLANTVGSASVAAEVTASRTYVDATQAANSYDTRIDPVPACGSGTAATCETITGCAWDGTSVCEALVVACPAAITTGPASGFESACTAVASGSCTYDATGGAGAVPSCVYGGGYVAGGAGR